MGCLIPMDSIKKIISGHFKTKITKQAGPADLPFFGGASSVYLGLLIHTLAFIPGLISRRIQLVQWDQP